MTVMRSILSIALHHGVPPGRSGVVTNSAARYELRARRAIAAYVQQTQCELSSFSEERTVTGKQLASAALTGPVPSFCRPDLQPCRRSSSLAFSYGAEPSMDAYYLGSFDSRLERHPVSNSPRRDSSIDRARRNWRSRIVRESGGRGGFRNDRCVVCDDVPRDRSGRGSRAAHRRWQDRRHRATRDARVGTAGSARRANGRARRCSRREAGVCSRSRSYDNRAGPENHSDAYVGPPHRDQCSRYRQTHGAQLRPPWFWLNEWIATASDGAPTAAVGARSGFLRHALLCEPERPSDQLIRSHRLAATALQCDRARDRLRFVRPDCAGDRLMIPDT